MSASVAHAEPRTRWIGSRPSPAGDDRRHIEVVSSRGQRRARPRTVYATLVIGGLFGVLLSQLLLSIGLSDGAYAIQSLQQQQRELGRTEQVLTEDLERLSSPQNLAANARAMGMVSNAAPVYLRLSDGAVLGAPVAATADASAEPLVGNVLLSGVPIAAEEMAAEEIAAANAAAAAASSGAGTAATGAAASGAAATGAAASDTGAPEATAPDAAGTAAPASAGAAASAPAAGAPVASATPETGLPAPITR